jgi:LmbE family N-acetylglucosaminyl deacetylase
MRVLAVGAHPDDLEILCGGTLARYVREGHEVVMCHVALGDKGSTASTSEEIEPVRRREAERAAAIAGADSVTLGVRDGEIRAGDQEQREGMAELVRQARPDVVITHHPHDYMTDHDETARLVFNASFLATLPLLRTATPAHDVIAPVLYHMDTLAGHGFLPEEYVDITSDFDTKLAMLRAHESQVSWLGDHEGVDVLDQIRVTGRFRGNQCGVPYAEGFVQRRTWLRPVPRRVLP